MITFIKIVKIVLYVVVIPPSVLLIIASYQKFPLITFFTALTALAATFLQSYQYTLEEREHQQQEHLQKQKEYVRKLNAQKVVKKHKPPIKTEPAVMDTTPVPVVETEAGEQDVEIIELTEEVVKDEKKRNLSNIEIEEEVSLRLDELLKDDKFFELPTN